MLLYLLSLLYTSLEILVLNTCSTYVLGDNSACVTSTELSTFVRSIISAYDAGVIATSDTSSESNWDYGASLFFSMTVITSIGKYRYMLHIVEILIEWIHFQGWQLCRNCFLSLLKSIYSKRKEFASTGSKFFPFRVDPFSE